MHDLSYIRFLREKIGHSRLLVPSVAAVIRDEENRLLLQRKAGLESWSLPAGAIEIGETPEEALRREVLEETGLNIISSILVRAFGGYDFRYTYPNGDKVEYTVLVYQCETGIISEKPTDPETEELRYFDEEHMPELALPYPKSVLFGKITVTATETLEQSAQLD